MRAPKVASLRAVAKPMAPFPPVITATWPSRREIGSKVMQSFQKMEVLKMMEFME